MIQSYKDLDVYKRSLKLAMDICWMPGKFPKEEIYALTNQLIRSSRSVSANIVEGWANRQYENVFRQRLIRALGSISETESWLIFAKECKYTGQKVLDQFADKLDQPGRMINMLHQNWKSYGK